MDLFTDILSKLTELENFLQCSICAKKCIDPIRIKTCGHYFCTKCLQASKNQTSCPQCAQFYIAAELDASNLARKCNDELTELHELLQNVHKKTEETTNTSTLDNLVTNVQNNHNTIYLGTASKENTILYMENEYHVNFLNSQSKRNAKGETPLHLACRKNKFDEVRSLIDSQVDINAKDYAGWAPLHEAIESQAMEIVEYLLQNNCLPNIPGADFLTPLHKAVILGNADIVRLLLKYGADVNCFDYRGLQPKDHSESSSTLKAILKSHNKKVYPKMFHVFLPGKVSLYCHSIDESVKTKLEACNNIQVVHKVDIKKSLTHFVIKKSHKLSFKIMQAMLEGLYFLTQDDADNFLREEYFINIPQHTFFLNEQLNDGVKKSMMSAMMKLPKLFDGIHFYIEDHINPANVYHLKVDKEYLTKLIKIGGGKVLHRPPATRTCESAHPFFSPQGSGTFRCCYYIIYDETHVPDLQYNMEELKHKSSKWLIDCVIQYEIDD